MNSRLSKTENDLNDCKQILKDNDKFKYIMESANNRCKGLIITSDEKLKKSINKLFEVRTYNSNLNNNIQDKFNNS